MKLTQFQLIREIGEIEAVSLSGQRNGPFTVFFTIRGKRIPILVTPEGIIKGDPVPPNNPIIVHAQITRNGIAEMIESEFSK